MLCSFLFLFRGKLTHTHTCVCKKHVSILMYDCIMLNFLSNITWNGWATLPKCQGQSLLQSHSE